jgi:hypothetical protein
MTRALASYLPAAVLLITATAMAGDPTVPLNGRDLSGWKVKTLNSPNHWTVGKATLAAGDPAALTVTPGGHALINAKLHGVDLYTKAKYGDIRLEFEVMVPKGSNSGVYLMGEYEVQVLDSFGRGKPGAGDMGAIYAAAPPRVNASKPPGQWQKYVIDFRAPRFDAAGKKTANASFIQVVLNGQTLHKNVEMKAAGPGGVAGREAARGPLMLQGNHGVVAYRNIKITPLKDRQ